MRTKPLILLLILATLLVVAGCAGSKKTAVSPYAGLWSFTVDAGGDIYTGTLTISDEGGAPVGSIYSERDRATIPLENVLFDAPALGFQLRHPMYGRLTAQTTIEGDLLRGSISVPGEGSFQIRGQRKPADT
jgi:hypothetical protein